MIEIALTAWYVAWQIGIVWAVGQGIVIAIVNICWFIDRHDGLPSAEDQKRFREQTKWERIWIPYYMGRRVLMRRVYDRKDLMIEELQFNHFDHRNGNEHYDTILKRNTKIPEWYAEEVVGKRRHSKRRDKAQMKLAGVNTSNTLAMDALKGIHEHESNRRKAANAAVKEIMEG